MSYYDHATLMALGLDRWRLAPEPERVFSRCRFRWRPARRNSPCPAPACLKSPRR